MQLIDQRSISQDEPESAILRGWFYFAVVILYLLDGIWLRSLDVSISERVQYGTAETGWGLFAVIFLFGPPLLIMAIVNVVILFRTRSPVVRILIGIALLMSLAVAVGIFGFDWVAQLFGAHADGSPVSGHTLLDDPNTY